MKEWTSAVIQSLFFLFLCLCTILGLFTVSSEVQAGPERWNLVLGDDIEPLIEVRDLWGLRHRSYRPLRRHDYEWQWHTGNHWESLPHKVRHWFSGTDDYDYSEQR
jgi:hypothetical protein